MSFLSGAECSTAGNPLSQFSKHVQDDNSLQRDRLVGRGPASLQGMRSSGINGSQDGVSQRSGSTRFRQMMNEFLQQGAQLPISHGEAFTMDPMRHEQQFGPAHTWSSGNAAQHGWAKEYNPGVDEKVRMEADLNFPQGAGFSPTDFARFQQGNRSNSFRTASPITHAASTVNGNIQYRRPVGMGLANRPIIGMPMDMPIAPQTHYPPQNMQDTEKGKGKMVELDDEHWEEQFAQIDLQGKEQDETLAMEKELEAFDRSVSEKGFSDFEPIWKGIQAETSAVRQMASDENTFSHGVHMGDFDHQWDGFDDVGARANLRDPQLGEYMFEEDNIFDEIPDAYSEGIRIVQEGGNLSLASLAFESAVQEDPSHVQAWVALGSAQAQNEKETPAIRALEQALKLDPSNLDALMGLAVSYTNEGYDSIAYRTLERWLWVKYPQIAYSSASAESDLGFTDRHLLHQKITDLFISAAQLSPDAETMDPDVQVGLGVLFYGAEEYDKAVDCFSAALASTESGISNDQSTVHLLWNRLGATLANSGRSEQAIAAYERALSIRPNFVRARYNLGVSCMNIGCCHEAAAHLLGALAMHKVTEQQAREKAKDLFLDVDKDGIGIKPEDLERMLNQNYSTNLYDTLRRVFSQMGRRDLADKVFAGMDVDLLREISSSNVKVEGTRQLIQWEK